MVRGCAKLALAWHQARHRFADVKRRQREVAAMSANAEDYDYMRDEIAYRLVDKLRVRSVRYAGA